MTTEKTTETSDAVKATKLKAAGKKAEAQKAERRARTVKGSHLLETLEARARAAGLNVETQSGYLKVTGPTKGLRIYIAKKGGKVFLNGFSVTAPAILPISEEDAKQRHMGRVKAELDFNQADDAVLSAYDACVTVVASTVPPATQAAETATTA